jgi:predicted unusual protein kinase regulating ubiquinone biosynthesis (AarF/ABC1/UbiB family)
VPKVYWDYSTPEVLVLEYCPGTKINDGAALDAQGLDRQRLARLAVESYLQQILNHGFFHAGVFVWWQGWGQVLLLRQRVLCTFAMPA